MKILHASDLHIGKRISEYTMLEEQEYVLNRIVDIAKEERPDAIVLAGDIYDRTVPSVEAVCVLDDFLAALAKQGKPVFIISGNHDSAERIAFGSRLMEASHVYFSRAYDGTIMPVVLNDGRVEVAFYMLPFIKPSSVQHYAKEDVQLKSYNDAMHYVIGQMEVDPNRKNVLIAHQYITDAERSESEDIMVGGLDNVDATVFEPFDYVALGHLHRPQCCGRETVRYSGSPMKYSFSEVNDKKSVTIVEIEKDGVRVTTRPLKALHDWHDLRGTYDELTAKSFYDGKGYEEDFVRITLTDEEDIPDGMRKLKTIYHRLLELRYDNKRTRAGMVEIGKPMKINELRPDELFGELYKKQNATPMSDEQKQYVNKLIDDIFNTNN